jgi:3-deoxy-D-manno-octulosonic-acid transferase/heptosyltransferase-1
MATPALAALRAARPLARVEVLASPWGAPALQGNPHLDRVRLLPATWYEAARARTLAPGQLLEVWAELLEARFDLAADLRGDPRIVLLLALARARTRIGFSGLGLEDLLDASVPHEESLDHRHRNLEVVGLLGARPEDAPQRPVFRIPPGAGEQASALLSGVPRPRVVVAPGTNRPRHRWPAERFAAAADRLVDRYDAGLVLVGREEDREATAEVGRRLSAPARDLTGATDVPALAAVLQGSDLLLANDSGGVHLAVSAGCPVVAIFGPTSPSLSFPYPLSAGRALAGPTGCRRPCFRRDCPDGHGYDRLGPEEVVEAAAELLRRQGAA